MADYQIWVYSPFGTVRGVIEDFLSLEYTRRKNQLGALTLVLPPRYQMADFPRDTRLAVMRRVPPGRFYLECETVWLVDTPSYAFADTGEVLEVVAHDTLDLLRRRIIDYNSEAPQANKTNIAADDLCKDLVDENMGGSATDAERNWAAYLTIQPDLTQGPLLSKACAYRNLLSTLQEVAKTSEELGIFLSFDIVTSLSGTGVAMEFRTYTEQRGLDRRLGYSPSPVLLSQARNQLKEPRLTYDWSGEATWVRAAGSGTGAARPSMVALDRQRMGVSPFGRIEAFAEVQTVDSGLMQDEANALLNASRPRITITAGLLDTPGCAYGRHFGYGDYVTVECVQQLHCRLDMIHVSVAGGQEVVETELRAEAIWPPVISWNFTADAMITASISGSFTADAQIVP